MDQQLMLFDYKELDAETRIVVQQRTTEIKDLVRTTAEHIVQIGGKLAEVRERLANGRFEEWLEQEFSWSRRTAYNFMAVHERFGTRANFAQLDIATSALYLLAAPGTPEQAVDEALERAEAGENITHSKAREIVDQHKPEPGPDVEMRAQKEPELFGGGHPLNEFESSVPAADPQIITDKEAGPAPWEQGSNIKPIPEPEPDPLPPLPPPVVGAPPVRISITINPGTMDLSQRQCLISLAEGDIEPKMGTSSYGTLLAVLQGMLHEHFNGVKVPDPVIEDADVPEGAPEWLESR